MIMNLIAREIVIDGGACVEHAASPFFLPHAPHATYFSIAWDLLRRSGLMLNIPLVGRNLGDLGIIIFFEFSSFCLMFGCFEAHENR